MSRQKDHELYSTFVGMKSRCLYGGKYSKGSKRQHRYKHRGITIHPTWLTKLTGFWQFVADIERLLGPKRPGYDLDRINNDGNYEPGNLQWLSHEEHASKRDRYQGLTRKQVNDIRSRWKSRHWSVTQKSLAALFNVSERTIHLIVNNKRWV